MKKEENEMQAFVSESFGRVVEPSFDRTELTPVSDGELRVYQLSQSQLQSFFNEFYLSYASPSNIFQLTWYLPVDAEGCRMPSNTVWTINMRGYSIKVAGFDLANYNPINYNELYIHYKKVFSSYGMAGNNYRVGCTVANYTQVQWFDALRMVIHQDSYNDFDRYVNTGR